MERLNNHIKMGYTYSPPNLEETRIWLSFTPPRHLFELRGSHVTAAQMPRNVRTTKNALERATDQKLHE